MQNIGTGEEVFRVEASDEDSGNNGVVLFRLVNTNGINAPFRLTSNGILITQLTLDRETTSEYTVSYFALYPQRCEFCTLLMQFIIEASDNGVPSLATQRQFRLDITDINDNSPTFSVSLFLY